MTIYGRFGDPCTIVRVGTLDDVRKLDGRKPDKTDHAAVKYGSYVVVRFKDGAERLYHQTYLRADDGAREIGRAIEALATPEFEHDTYLRIVSMDAKSAKTFAGRDDEPEDLGPAEPPEKPGSRQRRGDPPRYKTGARVWGFRHQEKKS